MGQIFKTINYSYFDNKKTNLVVIFPQAMQTLNESEDLIKLVSKISNILFIESGYFGITKIDQLDKSSQYSISVFKKNIFDLIKKYPHKKLYLIAGSVGAIHALSFLETFPLNVDIVVLAGPALYKKRGILLHIFYKSILTFGISFYPDKCFKIVTNLFRNNPKIPWLQIIFDEVTSKIGSLSYLLCLQDIVKFTSINRPKLENLLSKNVHIFLGKNDNVFTLLCDKKLCMKARSCNWINADHFALLNDAKLPIIKLLNSRKN